RPVADTVSWSTCAWSRDGSRNDGLAITCLPRLEGSFVAEPRQPREDQERTERMSGVRPSCHLDEGREGMRPELSKQGGIARCGERHEDHDALVAVRP